MGTAIGSLFKITEYALSLKNTRESKIYLDRVVYLRKAYYVEENKDEEKRNHSLMDNAINELRFIIDSFTNFKK